MLGHMRKPPLGRKEYLAGLSWGVEAEFWLHCPPNLEMRAEGADFIAKEKLSWNQEFCQAVVSSDQRNTTFLTPTRLILLEVRAYWWHYWRNRQKQTKPPSLSICLQGKDNTQRCIYSVSVNPHLCHLTELPHPVKQAVQNFSTKKEN